MLELKEELDRELDLIHKRKLELKEEVLSRTQKIDFGSLRMDYPRLLSDSK